MDILQQTRIFVDSGLTALNSYENCVYQFLDEVEKALCGEILPLRKLWRAEQILEEHQLIQEVA